MTTEVENNRRRGGQQVTAVKIDSMAETFSGVHQAKAILVAPADVAKHARGYEGSL